MNHIVSKKTIKDHIDNGCQKIRKIYNILQPQIKNINVLVHEYPTKPYIGFNFASRNTLFVEVHVQKENICFHLRPIDYSSSRLRIKVVPDSHLWKLNTTVYISDESEIISALDLIKKSYDHVLRY